VHQRLPFVKGRHQIGLRLAQDNLAQQPVIGRVDDGHGIRNLVGGVHPVAVAHGLRLGRGGGQ
jgi:hypothetical protein